MNWQPIADSITAATRKPFAVANAQPLTGGDINSAYLLQGAGQSYFIKLNRASLADMFAAEADGLNQLAASQQLTIPKPIVHGIAGQQAFLVLTYLKLGGNNKSAAALLGSGLAALHQKQQPYFGWHRDNTIGSTPQSNPAYSNWCDFWREQRLGKQLQLAADNGYNGKLQHLGEQLLANLSTFFNSYQPQASLLHGDLWGGNWAVTDSGQPAIFDPACYYGDRETDIAMTELFGGFSPDFYAAYRATWQLDDGYAIRKTLYNLYHILNHLNLFGGGYLKQSQQMMEFLLAELH